MPVKSKISQAKRNNQKKNKLVKQGVIKKATKKPKNNNIPNQIKQTLQDYSEEESDHGEDMLQMVDEEDLDFLKQAIANRSYNLLDKVSYKTKAKKRKLQTDDETLENEYEEQMEDTSGKRVKALLPIKTKKGFVHKEIVEDIIEEEQPKKATIQKADIVETEENESEVEEIFTLQETDIDLSKPISATQLLAARNEALRQKKIHIGTLSSGLLENPEEKVTNLRSLIKLLDDDVPETYFTVKKLVIVSLLEVFKDILPDYELKNFNPENVKLKKDTLKLQKYEVILLAHYRKFLQKLESYCFMVAKKKGDSRKISEEEVKVAELSVQAMCDLLIAHPYFNYAHNICQVLVPFLNNPRKNIREIVKPAICTVFKEDKKEEVTLKILRLINNYLKTHTHVCVDMLEVLLVLNLRDVNINIKMEQEIKNKKLQAKKGRLLQMSKRERKRKKKLKELEQEMLETKAEESKQVKQKNQTEIITVIFNIYFRILKNSENNKLLSACLEGLTKFAHCISLEYYVDMVNVLNHLLKEDWLGYKEQLHCIQTLFIMLSGQGEAIDIDPTRFYVHLYEDLFVTSACNTHRNTLLVLKTLVDALIKRRKKITNKRIINFVKRLAIFSLQLLHNGALGCLGLLANIFHLNSSVDILLDLDSSSGEGKYQPYINDPEYANASGTALFETVLLNRHYHPVVKMFAKYIASGAPSTGDASLPHQYSKLTVEELFEKFDMFEMGFNPPVPVPSKNVTPKGRPSRSDFIDYSFYEECNNVLRSKEATGPLWISI
ncbi:unnamed protein product [Ceutorhynchus assimilis]|uniref:NOC3-like protein n=1 Tax=Ceutorhynchus assimilis TaxID=467358 RepID=A0A9N9MHA2_9CUCU|nr:unnamed protein product [Ceutorhynchus assimilis]